MDKLVTLGLVEKFKNFSLETKMAELNHNKNLKHPDRQDPAWKLYFILKLNE